MKKKLGLLGGAVLGMLPFVALAQVTISGATSTGCGVNQPGTTIMNWLCRLGEILNAVIPVIIALAVVYFVWGVVSYVIADEEEAKSKGRDRMIWGIIGLVVIVGVWGLVAVLRDTFGLGNTERIELPTVPVILR